MQPDEIKKVQALYDEWTKGEGYPVFRPQEYYQLLSVASLLGQPGKRVLDVGCGTGVLAHHLKNLGHTVTGIDLSEQALAAAKQLGNVDETIVCGVDHMPIADENFDVVVCSSILMMVFDLAPAFKEIHRVLKKGGQFLIIDHHRRNPYTQMHFIRPDFVDRLIEGRSNVPRRALDENIVSRASEKLFDWKEIKYFSLFTQHPDWKIQKAHNAARSLFRFIRKLTVAPWTGNVLVMAGSKP